jgi:hypothetical protein
MKELMLVGTIVLSLMAVMFELLVSPSVAAQGGQSFQEAKVESAEQKATDSVKAAHTQNSQLILADRPPHPDAGTPRCRGNGVCG